jgi:maleylpyruvate isomerase
MKLVLHNYWRSSASHRVRIGLHLKGLAFEYRAVDIVKGAHHSDAYRAMNPHAQVPTLEVIEDDGSSRLVTQSLAILEYLDERWPDAPSLLPANTGHDAAFARARARALAEIVNSGIQPFQNLSTTRAIKQLGGDDAAWVKPWIAQGLASFAALVTDTRRLCPGRFSVGDEPTIADCCLIPQLASARRFGVDPSHLGLLVEIEQACLALPAFQAAAPDQQPDAVKS